MLLGTATTFNLNKKVTTDINSFDSSLLFYSTNFIRMYSSIPDFANFLRIVLILQAYGFMNFTQKASFKIKPFYPSFYVSS